MSKTAIPEAIRGNLYHVAPEKLITSVPKDHPLYDERSSYALNESQVAYMMKHGCKLPVICYKQDKEEFGLSIGDLLVADGRQRTAALCEARRRMTSEGVPDADLPLMPVVLQAVPVKLRDEMLEETMLVSNSYRHDDPPMVLARKVRAFFDRSFARGKSEEETTLRAQEVFNCSAATIRNRLIVLDTDACVQEALDKGAITFSDAVEISAIPKELQSAALKSALLRNETAKVDGDGNVSIDEEKAKAKKSKKSRKKVENRKPGPAKIRKILDDAMIDEKTQTILKWVLGDISDRTVAEHVKGWPAPVKKKDKK